VQPPVFLATGSDLVGQVTGGYESYALCVLLNSITALGPAPLSPRILSLEPPLASAMYEVLCLQVLANLFAKFQPQTK